MLKERFSGQEPLTESQVQIHAIANVLSPVVNIAVCILLRFFDAIGPNSFLDFPQGITGILFGAGIALACTAGLASHWVRDVLASRWGMDLMAKNRAVLIAMAIVETLSVLGLILFLLSGNLLFAVILMALAFAIKLSLFPTRNWLRQ